MKKYGWRFVICWTPQSQSRVFPEISYGGQILSNKLWISRVRNSSLTSWNMARVLTEKADRYVASVDLLTNAWAVYSSQIMRIFTINLNNYTIFFNFNLVCRHFVTSDPSNTIFFFFFFLKFNTHFINNIQYLSYGFTYI